MSPAPRALVFCRAGEGSLHRAWMGDPATRSYDVWLDCYCAPEAWAGEPARVNELSAVWDTWAARVGVQPWEEVKARQKKG